MMGILMAVCIFYSAPKLYYIVFGSINLIAFLGVYLFLFHGPKQVDLLLSAIVVVGLSTGMGYYLEGYRIRYRLVNYQLQDVNESLKDMALRDALTGIYNRRYLDEALERQIGICRRYSDALSMIMIDIDHFKRINDTLGHQAGDQVLIHLARTLQANLRDADIFARYGGEEFAVVLPRTSLDSASIVANKLQRVLAGQSFPNLGWPLTISLGIAEFQTGESRTDLISRADQALYSAKTKGRNQAVLAE
jgi:diguanylate cyclase (GGDEF)-like protein